MIAPRWHHLILRICRFCEVEQGDWFACTKTGEEYWKVDDLLGDNHRGRLELFEHDILVYTLCEK